MPSFPLILTILFSFTLAHWYCLRRFRKASDVFCMTWADEDKASYERWLDRSRYTEAAFVVFWVVYFLFRWVRGTLA
jgi:hypothetical protein